MNNRITDIYCPGCGAPARFDIPNQEYHCTSCGSNIQITEALEQKKGFRKLQTEKLKNSIGKYRLFHAECNACGADLVFEENEALAVCPFCTNSVVRSEYLRSENMPEYVIPFAITEEEAVSLLKEWCTQNSAKAEGRQLKKAVNELKGFYLPYDLITGPVHMTASRMDGFRNYRCEGFVTDGFVNRSEQLDNLLLDGMEPFNTEVLSEFDFGYVAGQRVKINDLSEEELIKRTKKESEEIYTPSVRKVLETDAVEINADISDSIRLPVLLPVYYIKKGNLLAAVNGQTGKVSVRALKESRYYFVPWWLKAILATIVFTLILYAAFRLFGVPAPDSMILTGTLAVFFIIVLLCLYSDTVHNAFSVEKGREIFTSGGKTFTREHGRLVLNERILERKAEAPVFLENIDGTPQPVELKFTTPIRIIRMIVLCAAGLFLPVIVALFLNGFDFQRLELGGSAVWFCIAVPVVPVYLLKFGIVELHENPWIYYTDKSGRRKRYRRKGKEEVSKDLWKDILRILFVPPASLAVWFGILCFGVMCWLTAFGF